MRYPPSVLDDIRARLPLSEVVGRKVSWDRRKTQPRKGDFWACCPFHQEKTPSFHVDDRKGFYKCFGCGASGDHVRFLEESEGLGFVEAVERLADLAGVALPQPTPQAAAAEQARTGLAEVVEMACRFYQDQLAAPGGRAARGYMEERGIGAQTARTFRLGFAPDRRDTLKEHLRARGVAEKAMHEAGLLVAPEDGRASFDRFRQRLMIPIEDARGRVVAFGGRALDPGREPKYLNSPETPLFHKGDMLFNLARAREAARASGRVVVVEGYLDAIALHQAGIAHVVAALGTAFTEAQITALWRCADEPLICFDGDRAGIAAAHRAMDRILPLLQPGRSFNVVLLPEGRDPDDLVRSGGAAAFESACRDAMSLAEALWARETGGADLDTPERRAALATRLTAVAGTIADPLVRRGYDALFRQRLRALFRDLPVDRRTVRRPPPAPATVRPPRPEGELVGFERMVLGLALEFPRLAARHAEQLERTVWMRRDHARFAEALTQHPAAGPAETPEELVAQIPPGLEDVVADLHGAGDGPGGGARRLRERFGILNYGPDEDFVEKCLLHFLDRLELRAIEADLDEAVATVGDDVPVAEETRLLSLSREVAARRQRFEEDERALADEAAALRKAARTASATTPVSAGTVGDACM